MKITNFKYERVKIKLKQPFVVALGVIEYCDSIILKIETDEGYYGYGEATPFEPVTGETIESVEKVLQIFENLIIGEDPLDIEKIHNIMDGAIVGNTSAKAAVDIALYDIKGKIMNAPLYKVLGGYDNEVETDITVSIGKPEDMAKDAKEKVNKGFNILKVKTGIVPEDDLEAIKLIREAVGEDIRIRIDANQGWELNDAIRISRALEKYNVESIEQSLPYWDLDGAKILRDKTNIRVMLDETIKSSKDALRAVKRDAVDILNIKLMKSGGLYEAEKINAIGEAAGVRCMLGCMLETKLAITAAASLVAAKKNITEADLDSFIFCEDNDVFQGGFELEGSVIKLLDKPGLGIEVNI